jgi:capsid protein
MSQSRLVFSNFGIPRGAIFQKADGVVGRAWEPEFKGADREFGEAAKEWLRSWYNICDVKGNLYDFKTSIWLDSAAIDRDGDIFVLLTESPSGYPQVQHIPAHRVGTRPESAKDGILIHGRYRGRRITNGVIQNRVGAPAAYCILGTDQAGDEYVDAQQMVHIADPSFHNQSRGIPSLSHAILELRKAKTSEEWELMAQMMVSSHALIEYSETGLDLDDPSVSLTGDVDGTDDRLAVKTYAGGMVRHFKSNSGSKVESINHSRPGDMWESFQDRVDRKALAGIPWPVELVGKSDGITGTTIRNIQARARASIEGRQDVLRQPMKRIISWAVAKAIKQGLLPASDDWYKWDFTMPPKLSIDPRNDSRTQIDEYKVGAQNMTGILQERGKTHSEHIRERCGEIVERKIIKEEYESKYGVEIDDRELQMLTPNDMAPKDMEQTTTTQTNDSDE